MQRYEYNLELQTQYYKIYYFFVFLHFAFSIRVKKRIFAFRKIKPTNMNDFKKIKVAVAGTGYVGMSIATLLAQHHQVKAVDVIAEKVEKSIIVFLPYRTTILRNTSPRSSSIL